MLIVLEILDFLIIPQTFHHFNCAGFLFCFQKYLFAFIKNESFHKNTKITWMGIIHCHSSLYWNNNKHKQIIPNNFVLTFYIYRHIMNSVYYKLSSLLPSLFYTHTKICIAIIHINWTLSFYFMHHNEYCYGA